MPDSPVDRGQDALPHGEAPAGGRGPQDEEPRRTQRQRGDARERIPDYCDFAPVGYFALDRDGRITDLNQTAAALLGTTKRRLRGTSLSQHVASDDARRLDMHLSRTFESRRRQTCELRLVKEDATSFYARLESIAVPDADGKVTQCRIAISDITARRRVEDALRRERDRAQMYLDIAGVAFVALDQKGDVILVNKRACEILGYEEKDILGQNWFAVFIPEPVRGELQSVFKSLIAGEIPPVEYVENLVTTRRGEQRLIAWHNTVLRDEAGTVIGTLSSGEDVTERRRAEEDLRKERDFNKTLIQASPTFFVAIGADGKTLIMNDAMLRALGYTREEALGKDYLPTFVPEGDRDALSEIFCTLVASDQPTVNENRVLTKDGRELLVEWHGRRVENENGEFQYFFGLGVDITDRKRAESRLKESERALATLMSNLPGMAYRCRNDRDWTIEFASEGCADLTGYPATDLLHNRVKAYADLIHPEDQEAVWNDVQNALREKKPFQLVYRIITAGGSEKWVWEQGQGVFSADGELSALEGFITDITAQKRSEEERAKLEAQLRHAQKMEAIGTLAGGIAHDFNNLLTAIQGSVELARASLPGDHPAADALQTVAQAARQGSGVTRSLLTFSRRAVTEKSPVDLCDVVDESTRLLRRVVPASIDIIAELPHQTPVWVNADATQIQQVLMNLAVNARDAMPDGGRLRITLRRKPAETSPRHRRGDSVPDAAMAVLVVEDSGTGMSEKVRARVFEPFFTTKPRGRGTGLGMSVIHGIITDHAGRIDVESELGRGTRVTIELPCCDPPDAPSARSDERDAVVGHGETVILVDDNDEVRTIMTSALQSAGYQVVPARDGGEAAEEFRRHQTTARLAVLDLDLPKKSGQACFEDIRRARPDMPAIFITGSVDLELDDEQADKTLLLRKPFAMTELVASVGKMLADSAARAPKREQSSETQTDPERERT
jgi:two-component system cell cycle sensor histidine kinase/response regulator CckA